jgi:hypothetical protein
MLERPWVDDKAVLGSGKCVADGFKKQAARDGYVPGSLRGLALFFGDEWLWHANREGVSEDFRSGWV